MMYNLMPKNGLILSQPERRRPKERHLRRQNLELPECKKKKTVKNYQFSNMQFSYLNLCDFLYLELGAISQLCLKCPHIAKRDFCRRHHLPLPPLNPLNPLIHCLKIPEGGKERERGKENPRTKHVSYFNY